MITKAQFLYIFLTFLIEKYDISRPLDIRCDRIDPENPQIDSTVAAIILQYPNTEGSIEKVDELIKMAHAQKVFLWNAYVSSLFLPCQYV